MRVSFAAPLLLLGACASASLERRPLVVLREDEPWSLGSVASQSPVFALYDDGLVIYLERPSQRAPQYASVTLSEGERSRLLASLPPELDDLDRSYSLFDMPHQSANMLHLWRQGRRKTVYVYGDVRHDPERRKMCPRTFLAAYDALRSFKHPRAETWFPKRLVLHFSEQTLMKPARQPWNAGWPDLSHPDTQRVSNGWVLHLNFKHLDELAAMWEYAVNSHAAVEISGRQGYVTYAFPFPRREAWEDWETGADRQ